MPFLSSNSCTVKGMKLARLSVVSVLKRLPSFPIKRLMPKGSAVIMPSSCCSANSTNSHPCCLAVVFSASVSSFKSFKLSAQCTMVIWDSSSLWSRSLRSWLYSSICSLFFRIGYGTCALKLPWRACRSINFPILDSDRYSRFSTIA